MGRNVDTKKPIVLRGMATTEEMQALTEWAMTAYESGLLMKNQTDYRNYNLYKNLPGCLLYEQIRERLAARLGMTDFPLEPQYENFLSVIFPGGFVQPHVDAAEPDHYHARANLICQHPDAGEIGRAHV
jgi:hypothetical protein